jgi:hypothetical protein
LPPSIRNGRSRRRNANQTQWRTLTNGGKYHCVQPASHNLYYFFLQFFQQIIRVHVRGMRWIFFVPIGRTSMHTVETAMICFLKENIYSYRNMCMGLL